MNFFFFLDRNEVITYDRISLASNLGMNDRNEINCPLFFFFFNHFEKELTLAWKEMSCRFLFYFLKILGEALVLFIILFPIGMLSSYGIIFISGLVVPDVPLEETEILRMESAKKNIELVCCLLHYSFQSGESSGLICIFCLIVFEWL